MTENESTLRRRTVLKTIGTTGVALTVGTGIAAANDSGSTRSGGIGYLTSTTGDGFDVEDNPPAFTIGSARKFTMVRSPDCNGKGGEKEYQGYYIWREDNDGQGTIYLESDRHVPDDSDLHIFHNVRKCGEAETLQNGEPHREWDSTWRVNFKPE